MLLWSYFLVQSFSNPQRNYLSLLSDTHWSPFPISTRRWCCHSSICSFFRKGDACLRRITYINNKNASAIWLIHFFPNRGKKKWHQPFCFLKLATLLEVDIHIKDPPYVTNRATQEFSNAPCCEDDYKTLIFTICWLFSTPAFLSFTDISGCTLASWFIFS